MTHAFFTHEEARGKIRKIVRAIRELHGIPINALGIVHKCLWIDRQEDYVLEVIWHIPAQNATVSLFTKTGYECSLKEVDMSQR